MDTLYAKLTALTAAVAMNGLIFAGVLYLFALQAQAHMSVFA